MLRIMRRERELNVMCWAVVVSVFAVMLWLVAISPSGAQAALPTTVAENMAGVTEFQYKMMAISPVGISVSRGVIACAICCGIGSGR